MSPFNKGIPEMTKLGNYYFVNDSEIIDLCNSHQLMFFKKVNGDHYKEESGWSLFTRPVTVLATPRVASACWLGIESKHSLLCMNNWTRGSSSLCI